MKYVDEFREEQAARRLIDRIRRSASRKWKIMEVCGGQTHNLLRYGIDDAIAGSVELIHGPGCPVCVTPAEDIDLAQSLSRLEGVTLVTFGDMLRVPGTTHSLAQTRASGGSVKTVYSPLEAVEFARRNVERETIFFAVGFETTAPATALALRQAAASELKNFSMLVSHVRVEPVMETILLMPENGLHGFLGAGHVCTITGYESYQRLTEKYRVPVVVTGFEPLDLLQGLSACVEQLEAGKHEVVNCYPRCARGGGNAAALALIDSVYEAVDAPWRGLGTIALGGLRLRTEWSEFDARRRYAHITASSLPIVSELEKSDAVLNDAAACLSGRVLAGMIKPPECPLFGTTCTPESPSGAPMVSSEGACAAYFRYHAPVQSDASHKEYAS